MICDTENCNNEATYIDQVQNPICTECVNIAVGFGESEDNFMLMSDCDPIDWDELIESIPDKKETWPDESTTEKEIVEAGTDEESEVPQVIDNHKCSTPDCENPVERVSESGDGICKKCLDFIYHQNPQHALKWSPVELKPTAGDTDQPDIIPVFHIFLL